MVLHDFLKKKNIEGVFTGKAQQTGAHLQQAQHVSVPESGTAIQSTLPCSNKRIK